MDVLGEEELAAVAKLWRRSGRELITSFSGTSMHPAIAPGQSVRIRCTPALVPGDVAAFLLADTVIVHRLAARSAEGRPVWWLFRGDANTLCDVPVLSADQIVGRIEAIQIGGDLVPPPGHSPGLRARILTAAAVALLRTNVRLGSALLRVTIRLRRAIFGAIAQNAPTR